MSHMSPLRRLFLPFLLFQQSFLLLLLLQGWRHCTPLHASIAAKPASFFRSSCFFFSFSASHKQATLHPFACGAGEQKDSPAMPALSFSSSSCCSSSRLFSASYNPGNLHTLARASHRRKQKKDPVPDMPSFSASAFSALPPFSPPAIRKPPLHFVTHVDCC